MENRLEDALNHPLWISHERNVSRYSMDGDMKDLWKLAYYPIFEDGKTGIEYNEPRGLVERPMINGGIDFREVPLRYLTKVI